MFSCHFYARHFHMKYAEVHIKSCFFRFPRISLDYVCCIPCMFLFLFFFIFRNLLTYLLYRCIDDHNKTHTHVYRRCLPFVYLFYPGSGVIPEVADLYNCLPFPISSGPTGNFSGLSGRLGKTP